MRFGEFFDERDGHFVFGSLVLEPAANGSLELRGIFVAQD